MVVLELRFPSGRYHASPWGTHVNEGLVEYPPSPWRLLRALTAVWHGKLRPAGREAAAAEERVLDRLLRALAGSLPSYQLPPAAPAHTRHYMPSFKGTTKVLDACLDLGRDAVLRVAWTEVALDAEASTLLARLAEVLGFLGRAESWVTAAMLPGDKLEDAGPWNVVPRRADEPVPPRHEVMRVLAPLPPAELDAWRAGELERRIEQALAAARARAAAGGRPVGRMKMPKKKLADIEASLPRSLGDVLEIETGTMRKRGWNRPPGSRWVEYARPAQLATASPAARSPAVAAALPTTARYLVASQAPPRLTEAVAVAEKVRATLQSHSDGLRVFSGKAADGKPLAGHRHAFILCEAEPGRGRVRQVTVYAAMGFDERAREALGRLVRVWGHGGHDLQLVLAGIGRRQDFAGLDAAAGRCPLLAKARVWVSHTPFVPTRHPKSTRTGRPKLDAAGLQIGSPEHDLRRLLAAGWSPPVRVAPLYETRLGGRPTRWSAFRTLRLRGGGWHATAVGHGFRLEFAEPVRGPIAVGYGAHFGLGAFTPAAERESSGERRK